MISDILHVCGATESKKLFSITIAVKHPNSPLFIKVIALVVTLTSQNYYKNAYIYNDDGK